MDRCAFQLMPFSLQQLEVELEEEVTGVVFYGEFYPAP
jgi:hypothetical protein